MAGPAPIPTARIEGHSPAPPTRNDGGAPPQPNLGSVEDADTHETAYALRAGTGVSIAKVGGALEIGTSGVPASSSLPGVDGQVVATVGQAASWDYRGRVITDPDFFVDPASGSDSNTGTSLASPLQTFSELRRRWGPGAVLAPTGGTLTVNLLGSLPASDPVVLRDLALGQDVSFVIAGTAATVRSGSFTATTALDRATNTPLSATDGAMTGAWTADLGRRVRVVGGARDRATAFIAADLGAKTARFSTPHVVPQTAALVPFLGVPLTTLSDFQVGDAYVVEQLSDVYLDELDVGTDGVSSTSTGAWAQVVFVDCNFLSASGLIASCRPVFNFYACTFDQVSISTVQGPISGSPIFNACGLFTCALQQGGGYTLFWGGLCRGGGFTTQASGVVGLDGDVMLEDCLVFVAYLSTVSVSLAAFFDFSSPAVDIFDGAIGTFVQGVFGVQAFWGQSASVVETLRVRKHAAFTSDGNASPTITSGGGDLTLGGAATARAWDEAGGAYTTARVLSWANLAAAIGGGGFGGQAHDVAHDSHFVTGA